MFKSYKEYKPSNMTWTKLLPINWEEKRISTFFCYKNDNVGNKWKKTQLLSLTKNGIIKKDINSGKGKSHSDYSTYQKIEKNDFIFCLFDIDETPRTVGLSTLEGMITSAYTSFTPKKNINNRFIYYLFEYIDDEKALKPFYSGMRKTIKTSDFLKIKIQFPPKFEQNQIANFLDQETQKIDNLIAKQEKLIELLEEQRKSIISYAVTKGVNPNAKMKVSGVEWLGEVPEHWDQKPFHSLYKRVKITNRPKERLLSVYREYGVIPKDSRDDNHNVASEDLSPYQFVDKNYLVVNKMKAWQGSLAISEYKGIVSPAYFIYQPKYNYHHQYFHYLMRSIFYIQTYKNISKGIRVGQWDLDDYQFNRIKILLPPNKEQIEIVNYIKEENAKINILIQKQTTLIEKLKEYRASIICHAVTGQIDVRDLVE